MSLESNLKGLNCKLFPLSYGPWEAHVISKLSVLFFTFFSHSVASGTTGLLLVLWFCKFFVLFQTLFTSFFPKTLFSNPFVSYSKKNFASFYPSSLVCNLSGKEASFPILDWGSWVNKSTWSGVRLKYWILTSFFFTCSSLRLYFNYVSSFFFLPPNLSPDSRPLFLSIVILYTYFYKHTYSKYNFLCSYNVICMYDFHMVLWYWTTNFVLS